MPGSPDGQRITQWRSDAIFDATNVAYPTGTTTIGSYNTASFASLYLSMLLNSGQANIQVVHRPAVGSATAYRFDNWRITTTTHLDAQMSLLGAAVDVQVIVPAGQTANINQIGILTNQPVNGIVYPWVNDHKEAGVTSIPAASNIQNQFDKIRGGQVGVFLNPSDSTGELNPAIYTQNADGTHGNQLWVPSAAPTTPLYALVDVPDQPWTFVIFNNGATNPHSARWAMTYQNVG